MNGDEIFILNGKYETVKKTILKRDNQVTGLIDLITIENGEAVRCLLPQFWKDINFDESLLNNVVNIDYLSSGDLFPIEESSLSILNKKPGAFYRRIYRPFYHDQFGLTNLKETNVSNRLVGELKYGECIPLNRDALLLVINQLILLKGMLIQIFSNVYPTTANFNSYGHTIKNLLVLTCIEVETQLQAIMVDNDIPKNGRDYNTKDYVKLKDVLQLDRYFVNFSFYKDIRNINPFENWDSNCPTTSLPWYQAYNKIKHEGDNAFCHASINNVISAISALVILIHAQFGKNLPYWKEEIGLFFEVKNNCVWDIEDFILPPLKGEAWQPTNYPI